MPADDVTVADVGTDDPVAALDRVSLEEPPAALAIRHTLPQARSTQLSVGDVWGICFRSRIYSIERALGIRNFVDTGDVVHLEQLDHVV